ncbi:MAG: hypothetical protein NTV51_30930 [Verrucomicrobia bacterium]|nr:hypothetical protein [Verrucomicrobiota bacterium]
MNARPLILALLVLGLSASLPAAEEAANTTTSQATKDAIRARIREDAKKQAASPKPAPGSATTATKTAPTPAPAPSDALPAPLKSTPTTTAEAAQPTPPVPPAPSASDQEKAAVAKTAGPATVLPKVEVNRSKPTELGRQLYEQEKEIAREKQLTKSSELDKALNDPKLTLPIFGGQSTDSRKSVAAERVSLMEAEKDLIEEIAHAKTKEEKATLQKELAELKKIRRELEHSIR